MTQQTSPFVEGKYGWAFGESNWNDGMDENLLKFSYLFDANIDGVVDTLPVAGNGTSYYLNTDKRVYFSVANIWYSTPLPKWFVLKNKVTGDSLTFDGTNLVSVPTTTALQASKEPNITAGTVSQYWRGDKTFQTLNKTAVGLANVDNTSDINKPLSTAMTAALAEKEVSILHRQKILTTLAEINSAAANGRNMLIQDGEYTLTSPITLDYAVARPDTVGTGFPGFLSKRYDIQGQSQGNTIFIPPPSDFAFVLKGSFPITQDSAGFDQIGNMTITNAVRTTPNTTNGGGSGIFVQSKAFTKVSRVFCQNVATGFSFDGILTSRFEQLIASGCYAGFKSKNVNSFSGPNAVTWANCRASNTYSSGFDLDVGSATHFDTVVAEGCGTMNTASCGMLLTAQADQIGGNVVMTSPYFELNAGEADLYINNKSTSPLIVTINGGIFARAGNNYTKNNIHAHSDGGGQVIVLLKGVTFLSVAGYTPSAARPFWIADANCSIIADENCRFNETTSLPTVGRRYASSRAMIINSAGSVIAGDSTGISVTNPSTGVYVINTSGSFGLDNLSYSVTANGCDSTATGTGAVRQISFQPISGSQFVLNCYNATGVAVNGPVSFQITSLRAGV